jgi:hypothetical protein
MEAPVSMDAANPDVFEQSSDFFWWFWGLNSGPCPCWAGAIPLEPQPQPLFLEIFYKGSCIYAWVGLDCNPSYTSRVAGMPGMYHHAQLFIDWDEIS